jgi:hypothetical protein
MKLLVKAEHFFTNFWVNPRIRKFALKGLPYAASLVAGWVIFRAGLLMAEDYKNLLSNIAATFLGIPLIYFFYEMTRAYSTKRLDRELLDYVKMQVDREILAILTQTIKMVYPYSAHGHSLESLKSFLSSSKNDIRLALDDTSLLGFQVLKHWAIAKSTLTRLLENPLLLQRLDTEQAIALVVMLKQISSFQAMQRDVSDLFIPTGERQNAYRAVEGKQTATSNPAFPDRYLLLESVREGKSRVVDFGDFAVGHAQKLELLFRLNPACEDCAVDALFGIVEAVNAWLELTGDEFLLDPSTVRLRPNPERQ